MNPETLKGHLDLLLLSAVAAEPAHGYAIAETLRARSGGTFALPEGTIYPALDRQHAEWRVFARAVAAVVGAR
jgi:PadR family transcriptional regulator PadR